MFSKLTTQAYIAVTESIRNFKKDERGVTAIEYGLIAVAIALFIVALFYNDGGFMKALKDKFNTLASTITGAQTIGN
ncbi:Flp family type IVb pilin [Pasteurella multocida]|uniref:Flp family type IVb pilin n=1 Tax=Pasteurella multocida TaxID=747 RepID=UPI0002569D50|nr:Flp family type IVb pilin [Pasteurella multocida]AFF24176.1 flp operon protein Flp1 [Pasteurella multocida subsp. multocida str. HN06]MCL7776690.1 Flp family type IVb pilin [Pasteurella multocida]MCL8063573.1 Flp family type IVb pilin [Pasteurella multocida]MCL8066515.1 Flp family type IVb pilin [Pasteurella multocida]MCW4598410.1 Flp family type IVb pilin [Pasteurella multocida subsp. multocida]